ncbi:hypothetical protein AZSP09_18830 [Azospira sp. I09]|nr:hypothetical protein AZSP09_18830 [Azospira sp. I09]
MPRIGKGECLWGKFPTSRAARLTPAGLCQGFAMRSSPAGTLCALLIPAASAPEALRAPLALRTSPLRGHVLRALFGLAKGLYGLATPAASRGSGAALGCASRRTAGRAVVLEPVSVVVPLSLIALQSRPSLLSRSMAAGLDRRR